ncbi:hypothetical protein [Microvirga roseola]|uniref:hypothetical protein n=1 Tax=Microvirga roseola TaxID=2883126 RepID=UPI001E6313DE|nr:hypothetical protein [Microvirga roseola]
MSIRFIRSTASRLGLLLYSLLPPDLERTPRSSLFAHVAALVWSYYDGAVSQGRWTASLIEGAVLFVLGFQFCGLLIRLFSPLATV